MDITTILIAFLCGALVSVSEYMFSAYVIQHRADQYPAAVMIRMVADVAFLALLFFLGKRCEWHVTSLLVGGALGLTLPGMFLTGRLLKLSNVKKDSRGEEKKKDG